MGSCTVVFILLFPFWIYLVVFSIDVSVFIQSSNDEKNTTRKLPFTSYELQTIMNGYYGMQTEINKVYLAGGSLRSPVLEERFKIGFPKSNVKVDRDKVLTLTSQGAMIRALQILNGEDTPMIKDMLDDYDENKYKSKMDEMGNVSSRKSEEIIVKKFSKPDNSINVGIANIAFVED